MLTMSASDSTPSEEEKLGSHNMTLATLEDDRELDEIDDADDLHDLPGNAVFQHRVKRQRSNSTNTIAPRLKKEPQNRKIVQLGCGYAGKTTIFKATTMLTSGFMSTNDRYDYKSPIFSNILLGVRSMAQFTLEELTTSEYDKQVIADNSEVMDQFAEFNKM
jgi:hypothetical protein